MEESISVRVTRLNNLILGRSEATSKIAKPVAEGLCREGLLDAICLLYNECNKENLKKKDKYICEFVNKYRDVISETNNLRVHIDDFVLKGLIGKGYFGDVYVALEKSTKDVYAIKKIRKCSTITSAQIKEERDIMANCTSEWITALQYAFQDQENLFLVMEYVPGGDLLSLMIRNGAFDEQLAQFYLAEMTLALNALHSMGYVHRDIKPENILLDRFGHLKLVDFGSALHLNKDGNVISLSPVGTPDYIAPELLQTLSTVKYTTSVHDVKCDYWSMGIIGYEFLTETTPFHEDNVHETYSKILCHCESHQKLTYPVGVEASKMFRDLIDNLVVKPSKRLTFKRIIDHPFFAEIDWENLRHQVPPIIPTLSGEDDTSNFEDVDKKSRRSSFTKTQSKGFVNRNDFCGQNLPFLGYSFVHDQNMEMRIDDEDDDTVSIQAKYKSKAKELQRNIDEQEEDIKALQRDLLLAQKKSVQTESLEKILLEAKQELDSMKEKLKEKTVELAACKTDIKTLRSSLKIEEEMRLESDRNISQILNQTYQKWEKAKKMSEQNYEKQIAEKKTEIASFAQNLQVRDNELAAKIDECQHLQQRVEKYKEMLSNSKEQSSSEKQEFDKNKKQITETYEMKLLELKDRLKLEKDSKHKIVDETRTLRNELNECLQTIRNNEEQKTALEKNMDELKVRLNKQIEENKLLREMNANYERKQEDMHKRFDDATVELTRLHETQQQLLSRRSSGVNLEQFHSAQGSLETINSAVEDQLRSDLIVAQENETHQRDRADRLEKIVTRLEEALEQLQRKPVDQLLEKQNEKLGDELASVREQAIVERQASRAAHLSLWKLEKQVEDLNLEKKLAARRLEQSDERMKKIRDEKDEIERKLKDNLSALHSKEERISDLQQEIKELKKNLSKEHGMWENAEMERMKEKSEIIEHVSKIHNLKSLIEEQKRKLCAIEKKNDGLVIENKRLNQEMAEEYSELCNAKETIQELEQKLTNTEQNYALLKQACTLMEDQLNELEAMYEKELKQNKLHCEKNDSLWQTVRNKDETIQKLQFEWNQLKSVKIDIETKSTQLETELTELTSDLNSQRQQLVDQQKEIIEKTTGLFQVQENLELQGSDFANVKRINENYEREIHILKEENAKILTELFMAKEEANNLRRDVKDRKKEAAELKREIDQMTGTLAEQKTYYVQREIKLEATQEQYKKLISYLQQKVEDLSTKKKKSFADVLFGTSASAKKENISPNILIDDSAATIKRMEEDLRRERTRNSQLKEQLLKAKTDLRTLKGNEEEEKTDEVKVENIATKVVQEEPTPKIEEKFLKRRSIEAHRFEMTLEQKDPNSMNVSCLVCEKQIMVGHPYWKCKECKTSCHRRCRTDVRTACTAGQMPEFNFPKQTENAEGDTASNGSSANADTEEISNLECYGGIVFVASASPMSRIFCAYQAAENVLLLGCESGLYSFNQLTNTFVHITGVTCVNYIATNPKLSKCILIGDDGHNLYQCDLRHLQNRAQASACLKPKLEASLIELPFANRVSSERWHYATINGCNENLSDILVIACTSCRIVILKFDSIGNRFKPMCALDTARPVSSILFTRHSAIVCADKFFEIDLSTLSAEEFLNESDPSISATRMCQPMAVYQINKQEFLLCFTEFGIFTDEYGSRSRPDDLNWSNPPTGFHYREPLLFVTYKDTIEVVRINKSYTNEMELKNDGQLDIVRASILMNSPKVIGECDPLGIYVLRNEHNSMGDVCRIDGIRMLKSQLSESLETFFSSLTSIPKAITYSSDTISTIDTGSNGI